MYYVYSQEVEYTGFELHLKITLPFEIKSLHTGCSISHFALKFCHVILTFSFLNKI